MLRNRIRLIGLAVMTGLLFSIMMAPSVLAEDTRNQIRSSFEMHDNPLFTDPVPGIGAHDDHSSGSLGGPRFHGNGTFKLNNMDLDNLRFSMRIDAHDLEPNTWCEGWVSVRDLKEAATNGADGDVMVGRAKTNRNGDLRFGGSAALPNPTGLDTPDGWVAADGWRIDQRLVQVDLGTD